MIFVSLDDVVSPLRCEDGHKFVDPKSSFVFSINYTLGPGGGEDDEADAADDAHTRGGDGAPPFDVAAAFRDEAEAEAEAARWRAEKMRQDWVLCMHSIWTWPASWSRVYEMMETAGWEHSEAHETEWQRVVSEHFSF